MKPRARWVLGITGGIASGKSTAMAVFRRAGIPTASADDLAHRCIRKGRPAYRGVVRRFGRDILGPRGEINRGALARLIFLDPARRRQLERIVHPCVIRELKRVIRTRRGLLALDIPLLFEAHLEGLVDQSVVISCTPSQQRRRLIRRDGLSRVDAARRIAAQWPLHVKRRKADIVLDNSGSRKRLRHAVTRLLRNLMFRKIS